MSHQRLGKNAGFGLGMNKVRVAENWEVDGD